MEHTGPERTRSVTQSETAGGMALLVGFEQIEKPELMGQPFTGTRCERVTQDTLDAALSAPEHIDIVATPLLTERFDAVDIALQLERSGFRGLYVVVTPVLPNLEIIRREIAAHCPSLRVQLVPSVRH